MAPRIPSSEPSRRRAGIRSGRRDRGPTGSRRPRHYGRWRAGSLALVYLLFAAHITHWRLAGKTVAPLELNEVMYTLELGIVTAGFIFMALATLSVAIFGRFFCSWGCHILALEDLCAWLLGKLGIRPKAVRSRVLLWVPTGAMFYMFIWPQLSRIAGGRPAAALHLRTDAEGWASLMTTDFWRNLPGPAITIATFAVCGFLIVLVLGSRSFCSYCCPYGAIFALADRVAPGRIRLTGQCQQCGSCTAACQSHIRVHEEIAQFGRVVNSACMKDLDCVSVCPHDAIGYGLARPSLWQRLRQTRRSGPRYDFSFAEDLMMAGVFLVSLLTFRGLYGAIPFLLTLAIAALLSYVAIIAHRLGTRKEVRLDRIVLRRRGRLTLGGGAFLLLFAFLAAMTAHSAFIRYNEYFGHRAFEMFEGAPGSPTSAAAAAHRRKAISHLERTRKWGILGHPQVLTRLAQLYRAGSAPAEAADCLRLRLREFPGDVASRLALSSVLGALGQFVESAQQLRISQAEIGELPAGEDKTRSLLSLASRIEGELHLSRGNRRGAERAFRRALKIAPDDTASHLGLGQWLADEGRLDEAATEFRAAVELKPDSAVAHYNLGVVYMALGKKTEAGKHLNESLALNPSDPDTMNNLGLLMLQAGNAKRAKSLFESAIAESPGCAPAHFNLARIYRELGYARKSAEHLRRAAASDSRYAEALRGELARPSDNP